MSFYIKYPLSFGLMCLAYWWLSEVADIIIMSMVFTLWWGLI